MMTNQQLAETCRDILAEAEKHESWCVEIARVALASLMAKPIAYADSKAIIRMLDGDIRFFTAFPKTSKTKLIPLFIEAPEPTVKLPELKPEDINFAAHRIEAISWNRCIAEIKRLNRVTS
ncbi:hypothetical protein [Pantoea sp.]|uniref:hypothetical protein n=1 Tax=Pantoea sp. TaxID=69393 RepID=UPI0031D45D36